MRRRKYLTTAGVSLAALSAGCLSRSIQTGPTAARRPIDVSGTAQTFAVDPQRTGQASEAAPTSQPSVAWGYLTGAWVPSTPAVVDERVFVGGTDHAVYAVDASTGDLSWRYLTDGDIGGPITVADECVLAGSMDGTLYALSQDTGEVVWQASPGGRIVGGTAVVGELVYLGTLDGTVVALDRATGEKVWHQQLPQPIFATSAANSEIVVVPCYDGSVYAFDGRSGARRWQYALGEQLYTAPAIGDTQVYFGRKQLTAIGIDDGEQRWQAAIGGDIGSSPAIATDVVIGAGDNLRAYSLGGDERWTAPVSPARPCSPLVGGSITLVPTEDGLAAVATDTGDVAWTLQTPAPPRSELALADGTVFFGSNEPEGGLYAVSV